MERQWLSKRLKLVLGLSAIGVAVCVVALLTIVNRKPDQNQNQVTGNGKAANARSGDEFASLDVVAEKRASLSRELGGSVELPEGARVSVPPGALPADTEVALRRLKHPVLDPSVATIVDIDVGGATLEKPATVSLPCPPLKPGAAKPSGYKVFHAHGGKLVEVTSRFDAERQVVHYETREFSGFILIALELAGMALVTYGPGLSLTTEQSFLASLPSPRDPPLAVPYYAQADAEWCWAAAAQMVMKSYSRSVGDDRDIEIWELARGKRASPEEGLAVYEQMLGRLADEFIRRGLPVEYNILPWKNHWATASYIATQLSKGQPVWLACHAKRHAIVAVGFNRDGVYIHDSSGFISQQIGSNDVAQFITWRNFHALCNSWIPDWVHTLTVTRKMDSPSAITVALMPDQLVFERGPMPWTKQSAPILFVWDGRVDPGYKFVPGVRAGVKIVPLHPTNSDRFRLSVNVSNGNESNSGSGTPLVKVVARLDDKLLGRAEHKVSPGSANVVFELSPAGKSVPLPATFTPGKHVLTVEAQVNGAPVDRIVLGLDIGPGQIQGLRFDGTGKEQSLAWNPAAEAGCEYDVYFVWPVEGAGVKRATTYQPKWPVDAGLVDPKGSKWLYVVAKHLPSGLEGPPSAWLPLASAPTSRLELLGILEREMSEKSTLVVMDRKFGLDQKLWSSWRNLNKGSIIRIDDEEMETTHFADIARDVDRGVNGTTVRAHAKGAKVYLVKAAYK